jgi:Zn-dependent protease
MLTIIYIVILIMSVIIHEVAHGYTADKLGDPTARLQGRLTLNPIKHIDLFGSIILPIITSFYGFTFGWAKPVPYNPYNLKNKRVGEFLIAIAGPCSNIVLALVFGIIIRLAIFDDQNFVYILSYVVITNLVLAFFNLIPIPPLDGSKLLFAFFPNQYGQLRMNLERYGQFMIIFAVLVVWKVVSPIVWPIFTLFTGLGGV